MTRGSYPLAGPGRETVILTAAASLAEALPRIECVHLYREAKSLLRALCFEGVHGGRPVKDGDVCSCGDRHPDSAGDRHPRPDIFLRIHDGNRDRSVRAGDGSEDVNQRVDEDVVIGQEVPEAPDVDSGHGSHSAATVPPMPTEETS